MLQPVAATVWLPYLGCVTSLVIDEWHPIVPHASVKAGLPVAWHAAHLLADLLWSAATLPPA